MVGISYLIGVQATLFAYFGAFRHLKLYVGLPLTAATFILARNFSMKSCVDRLYYPLDPLYEDVRRHRSVSKATPQGARGVREIERTTHMQFEEQRTPLMERDDLSAADKKKIRAQTRNMR